MCTGEKRILLLRQHSGQATFCQEFNIDLDFSAEPGFEDELRLFKADSETANKRGTQEGPTSDCSFKKALFVQQTVYLMSPRVSFAEADFH